MSRIGIRFVQPRFSTFCGQSTALLKQAAATNGDTDLWDEGLTLVHVPPHGSWDVLLRELLARRDGLELLALHTYCA